MKLSSYLSKMFFFFFFQAEDGIRDLTVTGVQTCALPIWRLTKRYETCQVSPARRRPACDRGRRIGPDRYRCPRLHRPGIAQSTTPAAKIGRASCRERV